jgi:hypothetical protein
VRSGKGGAGATGCNGVVGVVMGRGPTYTGMGMVGGSTGSAGRVAGGTGVGVGAGLTQVLLSASNLAPVPRSTSVSNSSFQRAFV